MNRKITRILSVLLAISMVTSVLPYGVVFAEEEDAAVETSAAEETEESEEAEESDVAEEPEETSEPEDIEEPGEVEEEKESVEETSEEVSEEVAEDPQEYEEEVSTGEVKKYNDQAKVTYTEYSWSASSPHADKRETSDYTVVTSDLTTLTDGTYVVNADTTISNRLTVSKGNTVNLIVLPGKTLTCTKGIGCGYDGSKYATLNIFGEGKIVATGDSKCAGIGGNKEETNGNITIHGTNIIATGGTYAAGIGGGDEGNDPDGTTSIKIYTGTVNATGGDEAAGIGGGNEQPGAHTYIYGGKITAESKKLGAGIGGGDEEGTLGIFIYGGEITAIGGKHGAGIGAGEEGGKMRDGDNGGVNIFGGKVTATGGSGAAGIGGGYNEDMSGNINISGDYTVVKATGGESAAGIGAGNGNGSVNCDGDMTGKITIACGAQSDIEVHGGDKYTWTSMSGMVHINGGAGIGAGYAGNMTGKVYLKDGNIKIFSGGRAAGIGGGMESEHTYQGGEGGDVYIGGGNIEIEVRHTYVDDKSCAIGYGHNDGKKGSVYIHSNNNQTHKYMRVDYTDYDSAGRYSEFKTAKSGDRSSKCHGRGKLKISVCNHKDVNGVSGLTYTIDQANGKHTKKCKFCGLNVTESHSSTDCECGYSSGVNSVTLNYPAGHATAYVAKGSNFDLPEFDNRLSGTNTTPTMWSLQTGWSSGDKDYEPGETVTVDKDMAFDVVSSKMYLVEFDEAVHGKVSTDITTYETSEGDKHAAAAGETVRFIVKPDTGYCIDKVTYKSCIGTDIDDMYNPIFIYSAPVEIVPDENGDYMLEMPDNLDPDYANGIVVTATFKEDAAASNGVVEGVNVTLGGELGLNFYVTVPDAVVASGARAVFDGPEGTKEYTLYAEEPDNGVYKLTYSIKAIYMDQNVTLKLVDDNDTTLGLFIRSGNDLVQLSENTMETSIYAYVSAVLQDPNLTDKERNMVKAMYTYGAYSVKWKYGTAVPVDENINALADLNEDDFEQYKIEIRDSNEQIDLVSMSLLLDSNTAYRIYFTCSDDIANHEVLYNNEPIAIKATDTPNKYYVEIGDIGADRLTIKNTITFDGTLGVGISPMSYVYLALKNGGQSEELMDVLKAFSAYSDAARAMI